MLNKIILIGRLTDDPELRYTSNGTAVCNFTIAVQRPFKNSGGDYDTDFIDHVIWRKQAETIADRCFKGQLVATEGRLQVRSYETDEGYNRRVSEVVANDVRFLEWPDNEGENSQSSNEPQQKEDAESLDVPF